MEKLLIAVVLLMGLLLTGCTKDKAAPATEPTTVQQEQAATETTEPATEEPTTEPAGELGIEEVESEEFE